MRGNAGSRHGEVGIGPIPVIEDMLGYPVAIGIEGGAIVAEAIPLAGILQGQQHPVVIDDVGTAAPDRPVIHRPPVAGGRGFQHRRVAARKNAAARIIQRQAQQEDFALARFGQGPEALFRRHQIHAADLVILAKFAPVRALRPV